MKKRKTERFGKKGAGFKIAFNSDDAYNNIENESTENIERTYPIEVIASTLENRLLCEYKTLEEFWCFITNEEVNLSNIERFSHIIREEILKQYPYFKIRDYHTNKWYLNDAEILYLKKWYKENNGDTINIKSVKKGYIKTLKMQD